MCSLLTLWFCRVYFQVPHYQELAPRFQMTRDDDSFHPVSCMLQQPLKYGGTTCNQAVICVNVFKKNSSWKGDTDMLQESYEIDYIFQHEKL